MPCFLNDPASMATNKGACSSETAGTATLITFGGSAEDVRASGDSKKVVKEKRIIHRCIGFFFPVENFDYSTEAKMSSMRAKRAPRAGLLIAPHALDLWAEERLPLYGDWRNCRFEAKLRNLSLARGSKYK